MTEEAQASTSGKNVSFCSATVESLPFRDAQFDAVACVGVIMHVDREERALSELLRVVKPGGSLIITFNNLLNPFAPAFAIYTKLRKPAGYRQKFHRLAYYRKQIGTAAVLQERWPDLLVPEFNWSPRVRRAASRLNRRTFRFGYEPVVMFAKAAP
jgi:ubiquinone/menaquinone biosynthesis C-methylase UbiE